MSNLQEQFDAFQPSGRRVARIAALVKAKRRFGQVRCVRLVRHRGRTAILCECACGNFKPYFKIDLERGRVVSCGCLQPLRSAQLGKQNREHGHTIMGRRSPTYVSWSQMLQRCEDSRHTSFKDYGGRGITVCRHWHTFERFLADMGERPLGTTLGRRDNDRGYNPANCRWETRRTQANNRRSNHFISYGGVTATVAQWAVRLGLNESTLKARLLSKWPLSDALNPKLGHRISA